MYIATVLNAENSTIIYLEAVDWGVNTAADFREQWWRQCEVIEEGGWGRRLRLFYHIFYGEGFVVRPGQVYTRQADSRPFAGEPRRV